jgi:hypothetical protein
MTPMRRLYQQHRPDFILRDDLENAITADSPVTTEKLIRSLNETKGGIAGQGVSLTLGNYVIETRVMGYVRKAVDGSGGLSSFISIVSRQGELARPDKYVKTDSEALVANKDIIDPSKRKISLESKRREFNPGGSRVYKIEMLLDPIAAGSPFFQGSAIERLLLAGTEASAEKAEFALWAEYNSSDRNWSGANTRKGNGNKHSRSVVANFRPHPRPARVVRNNLIPAD